MRRLTSDRPTLRRILVAVFAASSALVLGGSALASGPDDTAGAVPAVTSPVASQECRAHGASTLLVPTEGDPLARVGPGAAVDVASWLATRREAIVVACGSVALSDEDGSCELDDQTVAVLWPDGSGLPAPTPFADLAEALDAAGSDAGIDPGAGAVFGCHPAAPDPPAGSPDSPGDQTPTADPAPESEPAAPPRSGLSSAPTNASGPSTSAPRSTQSPSGSGADDPRQPSLQPLSAAPVSETGRRSGPAVAGAAALVTAGLWHIARRERASA